MELLCDGVTLSWAQSQHSQARFGLPRSEGEKGDGVREVRSKASKGKTIRTGEKNQTAEVWILRRLSLPFASPVRFYGRDHPRVRLLKWFVPGRNGWERETALCTRTHSEREGEGEEEEERGARSAPRRAHALTMLFPYLCHVGLNGCFTAVALSPKVCLFYGRTERGNVKSIWLLWKRFAGRDAASLAPPKAWYGPYSFIVEKGAGVYAYLHYDTSGSWQ